MLQTVLGLDAARIASSFLVTPSTMGQRLSRAKAKIRDSKVPFEVPARDQIAERTRSVLDAIYAAYGTGWDDPDGVDPKRSSLTAEAERLARLLVELRPDDAEANGLLALLLHCTARLPARRDERRRFVPLDRQDVSLWSKPMIAEAEHHLTLASRRGELGAYQLQAAIQSVHNRRALTGTVDWVAISQLYDGLVAISPSTGARVARAAAHLRTSGPEAALALLDEIDVSARRGYQPYWVARAHALLESGDAAGAGRAATRAIALTADAAVRRHLIDMLPVDDRGTLVRPLPNVPG
jgi:RNA polymerase sigma-70 factor (ECF subfamily)